MQGPLSGPAEMGPGHRPTCSKGALLGKDLTHDEVQFKGPRVRWMRDATPK